MGSGYSDRELRWRNYMLIVWFIRKRYLYVVSNSTKRRKTNSLWTRRFSRSWTLFYSKISPPNTNAYL